MTCWCGLPAEHHDGRELDAEGNLHRFNEPVRPQRSVELFDELGPGRVEESPSPAASPIRPAPAPSSEKAAHAIGLFGRLKRYLDNEIIKSAQYGAKLPVTLVNNASKLSADIAGILERGL